MGRKKAAYAGFNLSGSLLYGPDRRWIVCEQKNPDALIYMVWSRLSDKILSLDMRHPEMWKMSERQIELWAKPSRLLEQLRCIFWARVYDCRALNIKITKQDLIVGLMDENTFESIVCEDAFLAYFIRPIPRVEAAFEALMWRGIKKLASILEEPLDFEMTKTGQKNYLSNVFYIIQVCENRLRHTRAMTGDDQVRKLDLKILEEEVKQEGRKLSHAVPEKDPNYLKDFDISDLPEDNDLWDGGEEDGPNTRNESNDVAAKGSQGEPEEA